MKKNVLVIFLVMVMLVSLLMGCSSKKNESLGNATPPDPSSYQKGFNPLNYDMKRFDKTVHIRIPVFDRARDDVPDVVNNHYTKWIQDNFGRNMNIEVEFVPITRSDPMSAFNLLLVGGNWPTLFFEYEWSRVNQWVGDGAIAEIDINEFRKLAPVWFENAGGQEMFDMFKIRDNHYFAPASRPYWNSWGHYISFYRKDWYRKAGLELPKNYDEEIAAMKKFMELGFTKGKPIKPMGPFTSNFAVSGMFDWPRNEEEWAIYEDLAVAPLSSKAAERTLRRLNMEFNEGLITPEFELDSGNNQSEVDFVNGNALSYVCFIAEAGAKLKAFYNNNPDAELGTIKNITVMNSGADAGFENTTVAHGRTQNPAGLFIGFSSKATKDELKAAQLYLEWMAQPDVLDYLMWGVEGHTYTVNEDGQRERIPWDQQGDYWMGFSDNKDYWSLVQELVTFGTLEDMVRATAPKGLPQDFTQELIDAANINLANAEAGAVYTTPFYSVDIKAANKYQGTLQSTFVEYATRLVKAPTAQFDALYKELSEAYLKAGYQEILDERRKAYHDGNVTSLPDIVAGRVPYKQPDISKITEGRSYLIFK